LLLYKDFSSKQSQAPTGTAIKNKTSDGLTSDDDKIMIGVVQAFMENSKRGVM